MEFIFYSSIHFLFVQVLCEFKFIAFLPVSSFEALLLVSSV